MKKLLAIIFALSCSFFLNACGNANADTAYEIAAIELAEAIYTGKGDKVKNMLYFSKEALAEPGLKGVLSGKMETAAHEAKAKAEQLGGLKEVSIVESEVNDSGDGAEVTVLIEFNSGPESNIQEYYSLVKDGSSWKLFVE